VTGLVKINLVMITYCVITQDEDGVTTNDNYVDFLNDLSDRVKTINFIGSRAEHCDPIFYRGQRSIYRRRIRSSNVVLHGIGKSSGALGFSDTIRNLVKKGAYFQREIQKADFVYITIPIVSGLIAAGLCIAARKPFGLYVGGDWAEFLSSEHPRSEWKRQSASLRRVAILSVERLIARMAAFIVVHGEKSYKKFSKFNENTVRTVPMTNITMRDVVQRDKKFLSHSIRLVSVGTLNARKNLTALIECVRMVVERKRLAVSCVIVGVGDPAYEEQLRKLAAKYKLDRFIEFRGRVTDKETLLELYQNADILAVPSLAEGFPRVIYEALSQGCFVVANAIESIASVLDHRENALLVDFTRAETVVDQLEMLAVDCDLQARLQEGGRKFLASYMNDQTTASQLAELIRKHAERDECR